MKGLKKQLSQTKKVSPDKLIYRYKDPTADVKFNEFDDAVSLIDKIREVEMSLVDAKNVQIKFKSKLNEIKKEIKKHRSKEPKNTLYNNEMLYKARSNVIKFYGNYSSMVSEAKLKQLMENDFKY